MTRYLTNLPGTCQPGTAIKSTERSQQMWCCPDLNPHCAALGYLYVKSETGEPSTLMIRLVLGALDRRA